jgi:hypothetical protein
LRLAVIALDCSSVASCPGAGRLRQPRAPMCSACLPLRRLREPRGLAVDREEPPRRWLRPPRASGSRRRFGRPSGAAARSPWRYRRGRESRGRTGRICAASRASPCRAPPAPPSPRRRQAAHKPSAESRAMDTACEDRRDHPDATTSVQECWQTRETPEIASQRVPQNTILSNVKLRCARPGPRRASTDLFGFTPDDRFQ